MSRHDREILAHLRPMRVSPARQFVGRVRRMNVVVLAPLLRRRIYGAWIVGAALVHLGLSSLGIPALVCPFKTATGLPCPGCGLTTATLALFRGDFRAGLQDHPFAPVFLLLLLLILVLTAIPGSWRTVVIDRIAVFETQTPVSLLLVVPLLAYWLLGFTRI